MLHQPLPRCAVFLGNVGQDNVRHLAVSSFPGTLASAFQLSGLHYTLLCLSMVTVTDLAIVHTFRVYHASVCGGT